jgi:hypothetical protein
VAKGAAAAALRAHAWKSLSATRSAAPGDRRAGGAAVVSTRTCSGGAATSPTPSAFMDARSAAARKGSEGEARAAVGAL